MARTGKGLKQTKANRDVRLDLRISAEEAAELRAAAIADGMKRAEYARQRLFSPARTGGGLTKSDVHSLIRSLAPIGSNLNQVARSLNSGDPVNEPVRHRILEAVGKLEILFDELARGLA